MLQAHFILLPSQQRRYADASSSNKLAARPRAYDSPSTMMLPLRGHWRVECERDVAFSARFLDFRL